MNQNVKNGTRIRVTNYGGPDRASWNGKTGVITDAHGSVFQIVKLDDGSNNDLHILPSEYEVIENKNCSTRPVYSVKTFRQLQKIINFCKKYDTTFTLYDVNNRRVESYEVSKNSTMGIFNNSNIVQFRPSGVETNFGFCPRDSNVTETGDLNNYNDHFLFLNKDRADKYALKQKRNYGW